MSPDEPGPARRPGLLQSMRDRPADAVRAGAFAPLIGLIPMVAIGATVNPWIGVVVGLAVTVAALPTAMWLLAKRPQPPEPDDE